MAQAHRFRSGGLAAWSIRHPIGVVMIALAIVLLGIFSLVRLNINLLPHIIYPEVRIRILDPGVPAQIMEDRVTRQLEEQLAITEDASNIYSNTREGRSAVNLTFSYGKDIDIALRDASTRLDRARRFLPDTVDPPIIYKRDPSQIPAIEMVVSSSFKSAVELRDWSDYVFSKWLINLPGVAAAEVGGGVGREIHVLPDQQRLAGSGLTLDDLVDAIEEGNIEIPAGRLYMPTQQLSSRTSARFTDLDQLRRLPIHTQDEGRDIVYLDEVAQVIDTHEDEKLRIHLNGIPGIKVSIQKQPRANTVAVVDLVRERVAWLKQQKLLPEDISIAFVSDQSVYIRHSMRNAITAAVGGAVLAMLVVYVFLGSFRRTLIIGSAIPIAIVVAFIIMELGGLTLNIMTLGGLALGVGMLVDNTIVMMENIYRHQKEGESGEEAAVNAAGEVNSAVVAATSTNLAAVLPFLFIGGLVGLLFRELIFTISAAIVASLLVCLTLVPALSRNISSSSLPAMRRWVDSGVASLQKIYVSLLALVIRYRIFVVLLFVIMLVYAVPGFFSEEQEFLPNMDDGKVRVRLIGDSSISLDQMANAASKVENLILDQPEVKTVYSTIGGWVFGRSQGEAPNRTHFTVQLVPKDKRSLDVYQWKGKIRNLLAIQQLVGFKVRINIPGIRGIRISDSDEEIGVRIQGDDLGQLRRLADALMERMKSIDGIKGVDHTMEEVRTELAVDVDRLRVAALGLSPRQVGEAVRAALQGKVVSRYYNGDRSFAIRVKQSSEEMSNPHDLESIIMFYRGENKQPVYLRDVADVKLIASPSNIKREQQRRTVELSADLQEGATLGGVSVKVQALLDEFELPVGYIAYDAGAAQTLQQGKQLSIYLLGIALFLVLVVMAVQYESLCNPLVILASVPFAVVGVALGLYLVELPLSMPVWLGMIMLAGIVVNNAIVLVEYIELSRGRGLEKLDAVMEAARLRLRPILMTTLTTVVGMLPLAVGWGEGAEMLQPLAVTIVSGLLFSLLVSLVLVPVIYIFVSPARYA